ncbi:MAG: hypothetical protein EB101_07920 [Chitinophagia bacterium]|nr:hypothetical protein [Chitinophagia bacterium]
MPNWCSNNLTLRHKDTAKLNEAIAAFEDGRFFEHFVPLPDGKWDYGFCCENWGTKWDAGGENCVVSSLGNNTYGFNFDTAWSPPIEVYRVMCAQGFELEASYYEPGMAFVGRVVGNEDEFDDDCYEYGDETSDTVRDLIGPELDDEYGISEQMADWEEERRQEEEDFEDEQDLESLRAYRVDIDDMDLPPHTD